MSAPQGQAPTMSNTDTSSAILTNFLREHKPDNPPTNEAESYIFTKTREVLVGPQKVSFTIHPGIVCAKSSSRFLEAYISRTWDRGGPITLPHIKPEDFEWYLESVYRGTQARDFGSKDMHFLVIEYVCADVLNDLATMNSLMDDLVELREESDTAMPNQETIKLVYRSLPLGSPMRKWIEEIHAYHAEPIVFEDEWGSIVPLWEFSREVAKIMKTVPKFAEVLDGLWSSQLPNAIAECCRRGEMPDNYYDLLKRDPCRYHYHDARYTAADHGCPAAEL